MSLDHQSFVTIKGKMKWLVLKLFGVIFVRRYNTMQWVNVNHEEKNKGNIGKIPSFTDKDAHTSFQLSLK